MHKHIERLNGCMNELCLDYINATQRLLFACTFVDMRAIFQEVRGSKLHFLESALLRSS